MPNRLSFVLRLGTVALGGAALAAVPSSAAPRDPLLSAIASPYLLAPARIGALYGIVTSGYRSAEHNRAVGGVTNSYHLQGRAIDVQRRPGVTHAMIDAALRRAGFNIIESLDEIDHSHFAFGDAVRGRYVPVIPVAAARKPAVPVASAKPAEPALLADNHGVLVIDDHGSRGDGGVAGVP